MSDQQIAQGAGPTPVAITVQGSEQLLPKLAFASYDGFGAAGDFLPVVKLIGPGGKLAGQAVGDVVTAGASVDQTWFRGLAKPAGGTGAGIQFDVDNQGGWLDVTTNNTDANGWGTDLIDASGGGMRVSTLEGGGKLEVLGPSNAEYLADTNGSITIQTDGSASVPNITVEAVGALTLQADDDQLTIDGKSPNGIVIETTTVTQGAILVSNGDGTNGFGIQVQANGPNAPVELDLGGANAPFVNLPSFGLVPALFFGANPAQIIGMLANGGTFTLYDHNGSPIFEVRDDATVHIKTGQTVQADL